MEEENTPLAHLTPDNAGLAEPTEELPLDALARMQSSMYRAQVQMLLSSMSSDNADRVLLKIKALTDASLASLAAIGRSRPPERPGSPMNIMPGHHIPGAYGGNNIGQVQLAGVGAAGAIESYADGVGAEVMMEDTAPGNPRRRRRKLSAVGRLSDNSELSDIFESLMLILPQMMAPQHGAQLMAAAASAKTLGDDALASSLKVQAQAALGAIGEGEE